MSSLGCLALLVYSALASTQKPDQCTSGEHDQTTFLQYAEIGHSSTIMQGDILDSSPLSPDEKDQIANDTEARGVTPGDNITKSFHKKEPGKSTTENITHHNEGNILTRKKKVTEKNITVTNETAQSKATREGNPDKKSGVHTEKKPFVEVKTNKTREVQNVTTPLNATHNVSQSKEVTVVTTEVRVASPMSIFSAHILFFMPLAICWSIYCYLNKPEQVYLTILPLTFCALSIAQDFVNQDLATITGDPFGITAFQASVMCLLTGIWCVFMDHPGIQSSGLSAYSGWLMAAVLFTLYKIADRLVSFNCSLSERTVFSNLSPVAALLCELVVLPQGFKPRVSLRGRVSLASLVAGAFMFGLASPQFTMDGIVTAMSMVVSSVPLRVAQRSLLTDTRLNSTGFLTLIDSLFIFIVTALVAFSRNQNFLLELAFFAKHPSIFWLLMLSAVTTTAQHVCSLKMLRAGSATTYLVFISIAGFIEVALGILYFGDAVFGTPLACIGLGLSLGSGLWYASEHEH